MASDDARKKWGAIFMGDREVSVEQLNAMQEPLRREKAQKEQAGDYMERVRARAADRAREILGAAYAERQKVLDEARAEAAEIKKNALGERAKLVAEGEAARKMARDELARAQAEREEAEKIREGAHGEGYEAGMEEAALQLHEFRAELGQSLSALLQAIERQRKNILLAWREDLADLVQCAAQAGSGFILRKEHKEILRELVFQSLDMLENRSVVSLKVNPEDEETVSALFQAARERVPELRQWIVSGDEQIEPGGLVAESGSGRVDLRRENFRGLVEGVLGHLALPERRGMEGAEDTRDLVEREVARIAGMTPEMDRPEPESPAEAAAATLAAPAETAPEPLAGAAPSSGEAEKETDEPVAEAAPAAPPEPEPAENMPVPLDDEAQPEAGPLPERENGDALDEEEMRAYAATAAAALDALEDEPHAEDESLRELEEELFPVEEPEKKLQEGAPDPKTLAEGGFL